MKHFRLGAVFLALILTLSSCAGVADTSEPDGLESTDSSNGSFADSSTLISAPEDSGDASVSAPEESEDASIPEPEESEDASVSTPEESGDPASMPENSEEPDNSEEPEPGHDHVFVGATCTEPGKCECGATDLALGHDFADASCTAPSTCKRCGATEGSALGHSLTSATCIAPAVCSRCGTISGTALGHNNNGATCDEPGTCTRCGIKGSALGHNFAAATCTAPITCKRCGITDGSALGHNYYSGRCLRCGDTNGPLKPEDAKFFKNRLTDEENAQALAVAREFARQIEEKYPGEGSDYEKIAMAAVLVSNEYYKGVHIESGIYYSQAFGVFIKRESSCAGCCRALGLVLSCMGYEWTHVNENQWRHQWVTLTIGDETIWADGQVGWAGFGSHPLG